MSRKVRKVTQRFYVSQSTQHYAKTCLLNPLRSWRALLEYLLCLAKNAEFRKVMLIKPLRSWRALLEYFLCLAKNAEFRKVMLIKPLRS